LGSDGTKKIKVLEATVWGGSNNIGKGRGEVGLNKRTSKKENPLVKKSFRESAYLKRKIERPRVWGTWKYLGTK